VADGRQHDAVEVEAKRARKAFHGRRLGDLEGCGVVVEVGEVDRPRQPARRENGRDRREFGQRRDVGGLRTGSREQGHGRRPRRRRQHAPGEETEGSENDHLGYDEPGQRAAGKVGDARQHGARLGGGRRNRKRPG
jgi:hypothetical protein